MFSINKIKFSLLKYLYQNKKIVVTEQDFISIWKSEIFTLEIKNRKAHEEDYRLFILVL